MTDASQLKTFPPETTDVQSRFIIVHQLRASADIQDSQTKHETGWATTSDRASLMRQAADTIERLARPNPSGDADVREDAIEALDWIENAFPGQGDTEGDKISGRGWRRLKASCQTIRLALTGNASTDRALPDDVVALVLSAREVAFGPVIAEAKSILALDKASEAFASRVPWGDEPELDLNKDGGAG